MSLGLRMERNMDGRAALAVGCADTGRAPSAASRRGHGEVMTLTATGELVFPTPVEEEEGLPFTSTETGLLPDEEQPEDDELPAGLSGPQLWMSTSALPWSVISRGTWSNRKP